MKLLLVDFSFSSQLVSYFVIICVLVAVFYCFLKQLADFSDTDQQTVRDQDARNNETEPILPRKRVVFSYERLESSLSRACALQKACAVRKSAKSAMMHRGVASSYPVAMVLLFYMCKEDRGDKNQTCPICRRLIHRVRRLVESP